ncbi:MAG: hypothetical protein Q9159_007379 [Coniocarpon cinnabarinum]
MYVCLSLKTLASVSRPQILRARALPLTFRNSSWSAQRVSRCTPSLRTYATEPASEAAAETENPEDTPAESATNAASQATESLKGTAEVTEHFASEAASEAVEAAEKTADTVQDTVTETVDTVQDAATETAQKVEDTVRETAPSADDVRDTATETANKVEDTVLDTAASAASQAAPAPSTQSTPIRPEGNTTRPNASKNLYVGNLYFEVTQNTLRQEFTKFGEVTNAKIVYDGRGLSKGFGYIEFATTEQATAAIRALDQQVFEGRRMAVQYALASPPKLPKANDEGFRHPPSRTLYIGNMSYEMSDTDLSNLFRGIKNVTDVRVAIDRRTGQPRGYAHADFLDVESATSAAEYLKTQQFYGRTLRVDYTHSKTTQTPPPSSL